MAAGAAGGLGHAWGRPTTTHLRQHGQRVILVTSRIFIPNIVYYLLSKSSPI